MKKKITVILMILFLVIMPGGCRAEDGVYLETPGDVVLETAVDGVSGMPENHAMQAEIKVRDTDEAEETEHLETAESFGTSGDLGQNAQAFGKGSLCYVYVCGAVAEPGVYMLPENSRIYEAVAMAGGLADGADWGYVNQAAILTDGQMIKIPTKEETASGSFAGNEGQTAGMREQDSDDGRIDLNHASVETLMTLPGIGQAKAESIAAYREKSGGFSSVEELMSVDGIKEGVFNRIKDCIKVN